ncbi:amino acid deaminase [Mesorhizobium sp. BAC0120]|uniref:amino acid deaminase n=1 Tax=Mesorhizobium sp. BAC0120 TaxID=3090670 RepID=UPI00298CB17F|nr:amino acid deaminase [Mesorhizobium sp. BAC0120]MDW6021872.1 amino acid deaminase [Mesorhizobium sp. BAC0120]
MTLIPRLDMAALDAERLDSLTKGLPFGVSSMRIGDVGKQGWSLLDGDIPMPAAVIREQVLLANSAWMRDFTAANGLLIAPHGKTTMSPRLFDLQIADGAWAITVATVQQMQVCRRYGVKRVLFANQPVGRLAVDACMRALREDEAFELYCLADSEAGLAFLAEAARRNPPPSANPLRILVEIGFEGGRTGTRSRAGALALAERVAETPGLRLAGFECFEGVLPTPQAADGLIDDVAELARIAIEEGLFPAGSPVVISAGGSAFFDRVGERFDRVSFSGPVLRVLRSGCYLTHDSIGYAKAFERIQAETTLNLPAGGLKPALEVWASVQSRPERGRAMLTMGKRDVGFDAGLPVPLGWYRPGSGMEKPQPMPAGHEVVALNDQHCHMVLPPDSPLEFGDLVGFGIGHPCTTFDRWSLLFLVDEAYRVTGALKTYF